MFVGYRVARLLFLVVPFLCSSSGGGGGACCLSLFALFLSRKEGKDEGRERRQVAPVQGMVVEGVTCSHILVAVVIDAVVVP